MDLSQLEYLVAVIEERSFTRAAARVHITQSGVSAQIRRLETELGATLIDRGSRVARPTAAGAAALEPARAALAAIEQVRSAVDDVAGVVRGTVRVAMVTGCTITPLFDALAAFHHRHPGVELDLTEASSQDMIDQVRGGHVDVALIGCAGPPPDDVASLTIVAEGLVTLVPAGHALAGRKTITLARLLEHPLVCLPPGTGIRATFDQACRDADLTPTVALQASAPDAVVDLARRGMGAAVLSASMVGPDTDLQAITIRGTAGVATLAVIWRPQPRAAVRSLLADLREAFSTR
ncbi:MAG: LysR substrate-binding domain-containing protein [Chloroflexi bacterium]|nr:LysR substrate-binding domain-containing protein [Chloroflexota bacterium]MDA1148011.1 LysR substrate-binding domain-containing protein [Chloroflexota bacterium]